MKAQQITAPTIEPITLSELKGHLRLDSGSFADNMEEVQCFAPGSHAIANNYTTHVGAGVDVLGYTALVILNSGTNEATGTADTKIQESDDNVTYTDWTGGAFTQVTTANDNAIQEKAYTGTKQYIRTVSKVLLAACVFGTTVIRLSPTTAEDALLTEIITSAREYAEDVTNRAFLTQTWDLYLNEFPAVDYIKLPFGNLQNVPATQSVKYKDHEGTETTLTVTTDYLWETNGPQFGRVVLPYGVSWPSVTLYPSNPITIRFVCGWTTAALMPNKIKSAIKMICADLYENRELQVEGPTRILSVNKTVDRLLWQTTLWGEF
jgi:uncharacterized phiE125 gp8 family phage protein